MFLYFALDIITFKTARFKEKKMIIQNITIGYVMIFWLLFLIDFEFYIIKKYLVKKNLHVGFYSVPNVSFYSNIYIYI